MKPFIKFCTPFLNEWNITDHGNGTGTPIRNRVLLPIEKSFDALCRRAGIDHYEAGMVIDLPEFSFQWVRVRGTYIARSRNALVSGRICAKINQPPQDKFTHWFFVDSDIEFTFSDVTKLLSENKDIISGSYQERTHSDCYTAGTVSNDGYLSFEPMSGVQHTKKVQWVGGGCLLVKRKVFETVKYKWFDCLNWKYIDSDGDDCIESWEEDVSFCVKARQAGFDIWLSKSVVVKHHINQGARQMEQKQAQTQAQQELSISDRQVIAQDMVSEVGNVVKGLFASVRQLLDTVNRQNAEIARLKDEIEKKQGDILSDNSDITIDEKG